MDTSPSSSAGAATPPGRRRAPLRAWLAAAAMLTVAGTARADLVDQPLATSLVPPANLLLSLSVEWPTGVVQAYNDETDGTGCPGRDSGRSACYFDPIERATRVNALNVGSPTYDAVGSMPYIGYFDPYKCYSYNGGAAYFQPVGSTQGYSAAHRYDSQPTGSRAHCNGAWSGNFLNWATMQTIDMFRWAMTGGDRRIDTGATTVLQKAAHDGSGGLNQFPIKQIGKAFNTVPVTRPADVTPYGWSQLYLQVSGLNTRMRVSSSSSMSGYQEFDVSVKVCDPAHPESVSTCTAYGASLKPTGLIQENADIVRFGAFGYLLDNDRYRDGGVMRARMKFVGPTHPDLTDAGERANAHAEWRASDGTYVDNPDPADASATSGAIGATISRSGVIQYLNKFGRLNGYKGTDPVSELYYEGLRYFKNIGRTPEYANYGVTGGPSPAYKADGFPVITNWDDPLEPPEGFKTAAEWCPKNFIIGISDANTHKDKRLPGNSDTSNEAGALPSNPDPTINVSQILNEIIATELANEGVQLRKANGSALTPGSVNCCQGSAYLASLAYHANVTDIRPDGAAIQTRGKQTVRSFFVDVREAGSWGTGQPRTSERRRNQLWVAAKYGGFRDTNQNSRLDPGDATADLNADGLVDVRDVWDTDGDWLPDTYFEAGSPEALVDGLRSAFAQIRADIATNSAVGVSGTGSQLQTDTALFRSVYDPATWSGDVVAMAFTGIDEASGQVTTRKVWSAAEQLDQRRNWGSRRIVTSRRNSANSGASGGVPFRWGRLSKWQRDMLDGKPRMMQWLRGDNDISEYRVRLRRDDTGNMVPSVLGDIVDSSPVYVGEALNALSDVYNPGYSAFVGRMKSRQPIVYVGANDGMVHAFDGRIDHADGGDEIFAYIPSFLFAGVTDPTVDGLAALTDRNYVHRFFVNATPSVGEADFARTNGQSGSGDWRTVLVGGLGKGGRGFYALDVTDGRDSGNENFHAAKILWEFEHPTMGFSYGKPQIVKTARWGWVALLTSGLENTNAYGSSGNGRGYLYVVDIATGALLQMIDTGVGSPTQPAGLAEVTAYAPNAADGTVTEVYGGDLLGNVWRFDFTDGSRNVPPPTLFARLTGPGGIQPVTTGPVIRVSPATRNRYVFIGTGRLQRRDDMFKTNTDTFYALRDGTRAEAWQSGVGDAPAFPITRSVMIRNADLLTPISPDASKPGGWYHDLHIAGERVIVDPRDTDVGKISWLGTVPSESLCSSGGDSYVYVAAYDTGQTQLYRQAGGGETRTSRVNLGNAGVGLQLVRVGNNVRAMVTGQDGQLKLSQGYLRYLPPRALNWREITEPAD